jgi:hypothetical protein
LSLPPGPIRGKLIGDVAAALPDRSSRRRGVSRSRAPATNTIAATAIDSTPSSARTICTRIITEITRASMAVLVVPCGMI